MSLGKTLSLAVATLSFTRIIGISYGRFRCHLSSLLYDMLSRRKCIYLSSIKLISVENKKKQRQPITSKRAKKQRKENERKGIKTPRRAYGSAILISRVSMYNVNVRKSTCNDNNNYYVKIARYR